MNLSKAWVNDMGTAKNYAEALLSLTDELGTTEDAKRDIKICRDILSKNPEYISLTDTPALAVPDKLSLIDSAFEAVDISVKNLLKILCEKHSVHRFSKIADEYLLLYNESRGISEAEAISAEALSENQITALKKKLEEMTGKKIVIKNIIDKTVLGGVKLRFEGRQLDGSVRSRFEAIEKSLKSTII